jgi:hypothetical protein
LESKGKQLTLSIRFQKHMSRKGRPKGLRLALLGLLGAVSTLTCVGLAGARAQPAEHPPAQMRPAHHPQQTAAPASHAAQPRADQPRTPHAHVYLLRGLFNVFSLGMDTLGEELSKRGVQTSVNNYADWSALAEQAAERYKAGSENPIILIGHSLGADAVMDMAAALGRRDVPVALVIPFDGTKTLYAPSNVARVVNLTQRNYAYARPGAGFHGSLANVDVSFDKEIDHINIDKAQRTHIRAISEVMAVVGHPSPPPKGLQAPEVAKPAGAPADDTTAAKPADESPSQPSPAAASPAAPSPAPAAAAPPTSPPPAPEPAAPAHSGAASPPALKPAQDASTGSLPPEKPAQSAAPAPVPQPAPIAKPAPAKQSGHPASTIEN